MPVPAISHDDACTYADYLTWPEGERYEIIDGLVFSMSPAPGTAHQEVSTNLVYQIRNFLGNGPCKVFAAPFDVRLPKPGENDQTCSTVVQPDIAVICDLHKLDDRGCVGAPDWIIEILSPSTSSKDNVRKKHLYERHGVKEFWLIHPIERTAVLYVLEDNTFSFKGIVDDSAVLESRLFSGFSVPLQEILPPVKVVKENPAPYGH